MQKWISALPGIMLAAAVWAGQPVDINSASAEELATSLDGVGQSKAELIVKYRDMHGAFKHADELVNVRGIGLSTVDKNRDNIRIGKERKVASAND